ncbi:uncharacterized protein LOC141607414 [Silene latifolia]|uniref:uncharacterized protein LOC141607414 n=1 Tax=Silene latifolia TaxID=37657 RepID=UPI003D7822DE
MEVGSIGRSGGLAFMWKKHVKCVFRPASIHHMDFEIQETNGNWRVMGFYGWPNVTERYLSWELLRELGAQYKGPWVCIGDFNEVLFATEMKGDTRPQWQMNNFREAVDDCGLRDVVFEGYAFAYDNGQIEDDNRQTRLDRALCNDDWAEMFPRAKLVWVGEKGCEEAVRQAWEDGDEDLVTILEMCAENLQKWKGVSIGKIVRELNTKRRKLSKLNEGGWSRREVEERKKLVKEIETLLKQEEIFWRQRSRALWLKEGDRNTKYFHRKAGQRKERNHIVKLVDKDGRVRDGLEDITGLAKEYFEELFTSGEPRHFEHILDGIERRVTDRMNEIL